MDNSFLHRKKLLLVDDEPELLKMVSDILKDAGFETVLTAASVKEAVMVAKQEKPDLMILDVMLPDGDGFSLMEQLRTFTDVPIIFLTAKDEEQDIVNGFDLGADDYVVKPFRPRELISRINNILRRYEKAESNKLQSGNVLIDLDASRVYIGKEEIVFTALEYKILVLLFSNMGKTVTRENILDKIWDVAGNFVNDNTLTVYVKRIRAKLGENDVIKTIKGIGYRVEK